MLFVNTGKFVYYTNVRVVLWSVCKFSVVPIEIMRHTDNVICLEGIQIVLSQVIRAECH